MRVEGRGSAMLSMALIVLASILGEGAIPAMAVAAPDAVPCPPTQPGTFCTLKGHSDWVRSVAFSPDGKRLASGATDNRVKVWNLADGKELFSFPGHTGFVTTVAFSPKGDILASASFDKTIKLLEVATGKEIRTLQGHTDYVETLAFSPDGALLASGSSDKTARLWDVQTGREVRSFNDDTGWIESVTFSPDGALLAVCPREGLVRLWDVETVRAAERLAIGHRDAISGSYVVAFSPDGQLLVVGSSDNTIRLWGLSAREEVRRIQAADLGVFQIAFSPDGRMLACDACAKQDSHGGCVHGDVQLWDPVTGRKLHTISDPDAKYINALAFSPDGTLLATGAGDVIRIWQVATLNSARAGSGLPASAGVAKPAIELESPAPEVPAGLINDLKSSDRVVRAQAVKALGRMGPQARGAWPALKDLAHKDPDAQIQRAATAALVAGSIRDLESPDAGLRLKAVKTLATLGPQARAAIPVLTRAATGGDPDEAVGRMAVRVLGLLARVAPTALMTRAADAEALAPPPTIEKTAAAAALGKKTLAQVIDRYPLVWGREIGSFEVRYSVAMDSVSAGTLEVASSLPTRGLNLRALGVQEDFVASNHERIGRLMFGSLISIPLALNDPDQPLYAARVGAKVFIDATAAAPTDRTERVLITVAEDLHELRNLVVYRDGTSMETVLELAPVDGQYQLASMVILYWVRGQLWVRGDLADREDFQYRYSRRFGPLFPETVTVTAHGGPEPATFVFTLQGAAFHTEGSLRALDDRAATTERGFDELLQEGLGRFQQSPGANQ